MARKEYYKKSPLPVSFTIVGMFGALIFGIFTISGRIDKTWGFTLTLFSLILFIASMVSISPYENRKYWEKPRKD